MTLSEEQIKEEIRNLLRGFFDGREEIVDLWLATPNPLLGNLKPVDLMSFNAKKLLDIVSSQLEENKVQ